MTESVLQKYIYDVEDEYFRNNDLLRDKYKHVINYSVNKDYGVNYINDSDYINDSNKFPLAKPYLYLNNPSLDSDFSDILFKILTTILGYSEMNFSNNNVRIIQNDMSYRNL